MSFQILSYAPVSFQELLSEFVHLRLPHPRDCFVDLYVKDCLLKQFLPEKKPNQFHPERNLNSVIPGSAVVIAQ